MYAHAGRVSERRPQTHNVALAAPIADYVISMTPDGRILSQGTLSTALAKDDRLSTELQREIRDEEQDSGEIDSSQEGKEKKSPNGKLIMSEEVSEGHVGWKSCRCPLSPSWTLFTESTYSKASLCQHAYPRGLHFVLDSLSRLCHTQSPAQYLYNLGPCVMGQTV